LKFIKLLINYQLYIFVFVFCSFLCVCFFKWWTIITNESIWLGVYSVDERDTFLLLQFSSPVAWRRLRTRESRHNTGCLKNTWALSPITWLGVTCLKSPEKLSKLMARRPRRMPIKTKPSEYARLHVACLYPSYLLHMV
jgi:hypothetical protein